MKIHGFASGEPGCMISYMPPKGQLWGHRCGPLSAATLGDRVLKFLEACAKGEPVWHGRLGIYWGMEADNAVQPALQALRDATGLPLDVTEQNPWGDGVSRSANCRFGSGQLRAIAAWVDGAGQEATEGGAFVMVDASTDFDWCRPPHSPRRREDEGSDCRLGLQLTQPRGLTTLFTFDDADHYRAIKRYLAEHDVVTLSDKHVRPKGALG